MMSRYDIEADDAVHNHLDIAIGWDRPLGTYFVQVLDPTRDEGEDGHEILWRGASFTDILAVDDAIALIAPWASIPPDLRALLILDRIRSV
jgi:hypothetical protein